MDEKANRVQIANISIQDADTEVSWAFPKGVQWFTLQSRDGAAIRLATESGLVASSQPPYFTVKTDNAWDEKQLRVNIRQGLKLFFACAAAGKVIEVIMGVYDPEAEDEKRWQ